MYLLHTLLSVVYQVFRLTLVSYGEEIQEGNPAISHDLPEIDNRVSNASMITRTQTGKDHKHFYRGRLKISSNLAA